MSTVPAYLNAYEKTWLRSPHDANMEWFRDAAFGLFIHYGKNRSKHEVGKRIRAHGLPDAGDTLEPSRKTLAAGA